MVRKIAWVAASVLCCAGIVSAANVELKLATPLAAALKENYCLHITPEPDSDVVMCLNAGAPLTLVARLKDADAVEGEEGYWYKAEVAGGAEGWVFSTKVTIQPEAGSKKPSDDCDSG
jgi:hypothetical protein